MGMTRPTLHSAAAASRPPRGWRRLRAAGARGVVGLALGVALAGCSGDGSGGADVGGGSAGGDVVLATEPVDLPPGQTAVQVAWQPSRGSVSGYLVMLSRNHGSFDFLRVEAQANTIVEGQAGDEVRVMVIALNDGAERVSEPSPPSVPIRFHGLATTDPAPALPPIAADGPSHPSPTTGPPSDEPPVDSPPAAPVEPTPTPDPEASPGDVPSPTADPVAPQPSVPTADLRQRLLLADVRLPFGERSQAAAEWIRGALGATPFAQLEPIGTPSRSSDALRDVVWRDADGRLYWTDGALLGLAAPETWIATPALALGPDERWVDLVDLDGDTLRDWVVEHRATGEVSYRVDALTPARSARAADQPASDRLVGSGDFDGDGSVELLWEDADGALLLARPGGSLPPFAAGGWAPLGTRVIAAADLTGDGRDDLIARHEDGRIAYGFVVSIAGADALAISWSGLILEVAPTTELVAALDEDGDGRAALVWYDEGRIEIRGPGETIPRPF
ncbi:MAG: hypothetical protein R3F35_14285 [Myxococcota bacterium]